MALYWCASPDGIVNCKCCGRGVLEIKCPYCEDIEYVAAQDKTFCLKPSSNGSLYLHKAHAYFYQVQSQLFACGVNVVCVLLLMMCSQVFTVRAHHRGP